MHPEKSDCKILNYKSRIERKNKRNKNEEKKDKSR